MADLQPGRKAQGKWLVSPGQANCCIQGSSRPNTPCSQTQLEAWPPRRDPGTHSFPGVSQPQPRGRRLPPHQYSPPCPEVTGVTSTHSPPGRTSHVTPRSARRGECSPAGRPPSSNNQAPRGEPSRTVFSQPPRSASQWAALTWLGRRPASSMKLDCGIEPSGFLPKGEVTLTVVHIFCHLCHSIIKLVFGCVLLGKITHESFRSKG